MKMKTTKFLAVLAVLAMAFAAFAVIAPALESDADTSVTVKYKSGSSETYQDPATPVTVAGNYEVLEFDADTMGFTIPTDKQFDHWTDTDGNEYDAGDTIAIDADQTGTITLTAVYVNLDPINVWDNNTGKYTMEVDPTKVEITEGATSYYVSQDLSVKITTMSQNVIFYVDQGVTLDVKVVAATSGTITFYTVSGDLANKKFFESTEVTFTAAAGVYQYNALSTDSYGEIKSSSKATFYSNIAIGGFVAGVNTQVATGTTLVVDTLDNSGMSYGVSWDSTVNQVAVVYLTAPGDNVPDIDINNVDTKVSIVKGTVKVTNGKTYAQFSEISGAVITVTADANGLAIDATNNAEKSSGATGKTGTITLNTPTGKSIALTDTTNNDAFVNRTSIIVNKGTTVYAASGLTNVGTITLKNSTGILKEEGGDAAIANEGAIIALNKDLWVDAGENHKAIAGIASSTGSIDTSSISEPLNISSGVFSNITVYENQIVTLIGDASIQGTLTVFGVMNINSGVKLTVETSKTVTDSVFLASGPYAIIKNEGTVSIVTKSVATNSNADYVAFTVEEYATFVNDGTITASSKAPATGYKNMGSISISSALFVNNGAITVGTYDKAVLDVMSNYGIMNLSGEISMSGSVMAIYNYGTVNLNNAYATSAIKIDQSAEGAVLDIKQLKVDAQNDANNDATAKLIVTNKGHKARSVSSGGNEKISFYGGWADAANATVTIKGLKITEGKMYNDDLKLTEAMILSGSVTLACSDATIQTGTTAYAKFTMTNDFIVDNKLNIPARSTFTGGNYVVDGSIAALPTGTSGATFAPASMDVTGKVTGDGVTTPSTGRFAYYVTDNGSTVHTSLETAVAEAALAEISVVNVESKGSYYPYIVSEDLIIPAGMMILGSGEHLSVLSDVTVTGTAVVSFDSITVYGSLYAADKNSITGTVYSDVMIEGDEDMTYLNFADAVLIGGSMVLNGYGGNTTVTSDIEIPAGTTIDLSDAENVGKTLEFVGCTLTISGTLIVLGDGSDAADWYLNTPELSLEIYDSHTDKAGLKVNGFLYEAGDSSKRWWYPDGIHYTAELNDESFNVSTSVANIAVAAATAEDNEITLTAKDEIGDFSVVGVKDEPLTLNVATDLDAGTITLDNVAVVFVKGNEVTAKFTNGLGSITIKDALVDGSLEIVEDAALVMTGGLTDIETTDSETVYYLAFDGITGIDGFTASMAESYSDADVLCPEIIVDGVLTVENRTNEIIPIAKIYGTMLVDNGSSIELYVAYVYGALVAAEKTSSAMAGTVDANVLFIGTDLYSVYDKKFVQIADGAVLSGNVSVITIYAAPTAEIDSEIIEDLKSLTMQVDYITYLYIYSTGDNVPAMGLMVPSADAQVTKFLDKDGEEITSIPVSVNGDISTKTFGIYSEIATGKFGYSIEDRVFFGDYIASNDDVYVVYLPLSLEGKVFNAIVEYDIYSVQIKTDGSIKAVYIDGTLATTSSMANVFILGNIVAGTHKVTVEPVAGYSADKCYLYTDDGTKLTGMTFTFTEDDLKEGQTVVIYNVAGTEVIPTPEPEPVTPEEKSEWTITTILLCVLVVLIAIMAVIVALRLNRN